MKKIIFSKRKNKLLQQNLRRLKKDGRRKNDRLSGNNKS